MIVPVLIGIIIWLLSFIKRPNKWLYVYFIIVICTSSFVFLIEDELQISRQESHQYAFLVLYAGLLMKFLGYVGLKLSDRRPTKNQAKLFSINADLTDLGLIILGLLPYFVSLIHLKFN